MRLPVSLLIWLKLTFSRSLVAGKSWIGQDTSERRRKPFQYARGAMERSYTTNLATGQNLNVPTTRVLCIGSRAAVLTPFRQKISRPREAALRPQLPRRSLLELGRNRIELRIEGAADRIHAGDDHDRDAGGNQPVFNCGSA